MCLIPPHSNSSLGQHPFSYSFLRWLGTYMGATDAWGRWANYSLPLPELKCAEKGSKPHVISIPNASPMNSQGYSPIDSNSIIAVL